MISTCDEGGREWEERVENVSPPQPLLPRYFERLRSGETGPETAEAERVEHGDFPQPDAPTDPLPGSGVIAVDPGSVPLSQLAPHLPDPARPFWWFSSTPLPHRKISAG